MIAPFGLTAPARMENVESGSFSEPAIETVILAVEGETMDPTDHYKELVGAKGWEILEELRGKVSAILAKYAIAVLPDEELRKIVPGLRGGEEASVGTMGEPIIVKDSLFFEGI
jgi:hypothetical protein